MTDYTPEEKARQFVHATQSYTSLKEERDELLGALESLIVYADTMQHRYEDLANLAPDSTINPRLTIARAIIAKMEK